MGFRLLRDLFRLPRPELARRIGPDALDQLDCMRGTAAESLLRYRPPDRFERRLEFSFGIESHGALAFPLQRLIRGLATFLVARDGGVQRFALVLGHERGASTRIEIGLLAPRRDAQSLFELTRTRLERIAAARARACADAARRRSAAAVPTAPRSLRHASRRGTGLAEARRTPARTARRRGFARPSLRRRPSACACLAIRNGGGDSCSNFRQTAPALFRSASGARKPRW